MNDLIDVTAAILFYNGRLLIAKRKETGKLPDVWEFPGGKVEAGETPEDCLKREMEEEFNIGVTIGACLGEGIYHYNHGTIKLIAYRTTWVAGELTIRDHQAIEWVKIDDLANYNFAPADIPFVEKLRSGEITL